LENFLQDSVKKYGFSGYTELRGRENRSGRVTMLRDISAVSLERESSGYYLLPWVRASGVTISGK